MLKTLELDQILSDFWTKTKVENVNNLKFIIQGERERKKKEAICMNSYIFLN